MNCQIDTSTPAVWRERLRRALACSLSLLAHGVLAWTVLAYSGVQAGGTQRQHGTQRPLTVYLKESAAAISPAAETASPGFAEFTPPRVEQVRQVQQEVDRDGGVAPAIILPPPPEARYFRSSELSERPQVVQDIPPDLGHGFVGVPAQSVILRLFINEEGGVDRVAAEEAYLPPERTALLIEAFSKVTFRPGLRDGTPVKSQMRIQVRLDSLLPMQ